MIVEYLPAIIVWYLLIGVAIATIEVYESWRVRKLLGGTVHVGKIDFIRIVFMWFILLTLSLTTKKYQELSKIKL